MSTKGIEAFKAQLNELETAIVNAVTDELQRIGRPVSMNEFRHIPFAESVQDYIEFIRLDSDKVPILDCSFQDVSEKHLSAFISDNEIDHWDMIALVELLINIQPVQP